MLDRLALTVVCAVALAVFRAAQGTVWVAAWTLHVLFTPIVLVLDLIEEVASCFRSR